MRNVPATYTLEPIDTSRVELNAEVAALTERLAGNAHDQWARRRLAEGWKWGPRRDDEKKEHPCLAPYADLPETEKEYDRVAAMETLKAVLALGYRIESPQSPLLEPQADSELQNLLGRLHDASGDMAGLLALWRVRGEQEALWGRSPEPYRHLADRLLSLGRHLSPPRWSARGSAPGLETFACANSTGWPRCAVGRPSEPIAS
jgi:hypothetical protein